MATPERYFEDYAAGSISEYGSVAVQTSEILDFAEQFGPGSWWKERESENGASGSSIASEWLVIGIMMRMFAQHFLPGEASIASPGVEEIRWFKPVRAGDMLRVRVSVLEAKRSRSKPDRGIVRAFVETFNQDGQLVLSLKSANLFQCRNRVISSV
jgi:acyl dehydratase